MLRIARTLSTTWVAAAMLTSACADQPTEPVGATDPAMAPAFAVVYSGWSQAMRLEDVPGTHPMFNTPALDGCPFPSRDGKLFFMASNRDGSMKNGLVNSIDIWVSKRASKDDPWGEPVNVGAPINTEFNDFCPTLARDGHTFFFVSNRPGACGGASDGGDIYMSRMRQDGSFTEPQHLGCDVNSAGVEQSPVPLPNAGGGPVLYFSSNRAGGFSAEAPGAVLGDHDVYFSEWRGGRYQAAQLLPGVNSTADDAQPNVSRDGLELFFFSTRTGPDTYGLADIYSATRPRITAGWSAPVNLGAMVNSSAPDSRPSLSWDGLTLYFGSSRTGSEGSADIFFSERSVIR